MVTPSNGYFVIADVSGYTQFLARNEFEHAQGILQEVTDLVISKLTAPLQFVELEGDAVFVFAPDAAVADAERLLDIMETCYAAFRMRVDQMKLNTTCTCSACRALPSLDLKFVGHRGQYVRQRTPTGTQLVGPGVTIAHLLLKNRVIASTGVQAYAFVSDDFLASSSNNRLTSAEDLSLRSDGGAVRHVEDVNQFGQIEGWVFDLARCVDRHRQHLRNEVAEQPIDMEFITPLEVPASFAWGYVTQPSERLRWQVDVRSAYNIPSENGRTEVGWVGHCDHGSYTMQHRIVDWKPFHYVTMQTTTKGLSPTKPPPSQVDFIFEEGPTGVVLRFIVRLYNCNVLQRWMFRLAYKWVYREWEDHFRRFREITAADYQRALEVQEETA